MIGPVNEDMPNADTTARLARELGLGAAMSIGIGTMVCAGIFVLPGIAASKAGPMVVFAFALCGFVSVLIALCMAELATGMPFAGGGYLFVVRAFGPLAGAVIGWGLWLSLIFASAFYMIGFGYYISDLLGMPPLLLALVMTSLLIALNYIGTKETGGTQNFMVAGLLFVLLIFFFRAVFDIDMHNLRPLVPPEIGIKGFLTIIPVLFITYMGFAEIAAVSEEIRNPSRNLPIALVGSVVVVTLVYCSVEFCIVGLMRYDALGMNSETVLMELARQLMGHMGYYLVLLGGILATVSSANASIMAASRISFAMGRDSLMPNWFNQINPRFKTPYRSILVSGGLTLLMLVLLGQHLELLAEIGALLSLMIYGLICLACMIMRHAGQVWYRPTFRTPVYPLVPILGLLGCLFVIINGSKPSLLICASLITVSLICYIMFLRGQTQMVCATDLLWQQKVVEPLVTKAEEYLEVRHVKTPFILVPLANPATERSLLRVSTALAKAQRAQLHMIHVVGLPMQTPLEAGIIDFEQKRRKQETILDVASRRATEQGIRSRVNALVAHNVPSAILSVANMEHVDLIVMGWSGEVRAPRIQRTSVAGVLKYAETNVLVLNDHGLNDVRSILVPISGGPHARFGLKIAHDLATQWDAKITALKVQIGYGKSAAHSEFDRESLALFQGMAEEFVRESLEEAHVSADVRVVIHTDISRAIIQAASDHDLVVIGASNEWILQQRLFGSIPDRVANGASASVLMVRSKS